MLTHNAIYSRILPRRDLPDLGQNLLINRKSDIFHLHRICVTVYNVKVR